jgi:hypothetical protein
MVVPNYTYLKLKMLGPIGVITVRPSYEHAYECDMKCVEHGEAVLESATLVANLDGLAKEIPTPNAMPATLSPRKMSSLYPSTPPTRIGRR